MSLPLTIVSDIDERSSDVVMISFSSIDVNDNNNKRKSYVPKTFGKSFEEACTTFEGLDAGAERHEWDMGALHDKARDVMAANVYRQWQRAMNMISNELQQEQGLDMNAVDPYDFDSEDHYTRTVHAFMQLQFGVTSDTREKVGEYLDTLTKPIKLSIADAQTRLMAIVERADKYLPGDCQFYQSGNPPNPTDEPYFDRCIKGIIVRMCPEQWRKEFEKVHPSLQRTTLSEVVEWHKKHQENEDYVGNGLSKRKSSSSTQGGYDIDK